MIQTLKNFTLGQVIMFKQIHVDPLIKLKKYDGAYTNVGAGIDKNGNPVTGLTEDVVDKAGKVTIEGTRKVMERKLDLAEGTLKQSSVFWQTYNVRVGSDIEQLELNNAHDLLKYLFLHAQTIVANSLEEIEKDSRVEYVLYSEEQESKNRVKKRSALKEAYVKAEKLDNETKVSILSIHGIIVDASNTNTIIDKLDEILEADPKAFLALLEDKNLEFKSLVTKCLDKGIMFIKDGAIVHGEVIVGHDRDSASIAVASDTKLQTILKAKLSGDMDIINGVLNDQKNKK